MVHIYGTLGPACQDEKILMEMFSLGMTGMRLNLSHVTLAESEDLIRKMNRAAEKCGTKPQLLVDLQGPELRTGSVTEPVMLKNGEIVEICAVLGEKNLTKERIKNGQNESVGNPGIEKNGSMVQKRDRTSSKENIGKDTNKLKTLNIRKGEDSKANTGDKKIMLPKIMFPYLLPGQEVLLDDGKIHLKIVENQGESAESGGEGKRYFAKVLWGGLLKSRKSVALPGAKIYPPTLTDADLENIRIAKKMGVTGVMQPFVRDHRDLEYVKNALREAGAGNAKLFAKIENMDGVRKLDELIPEADEIVIARGDLGNAMHLWDLPGVQRKISQKCKAAGKPFMVVTQMLASMERNPVPTRAEVNDIFHAVLDGASSVMVTGETAVGDYPVETIRYLVNTVRSAECALQE